MSRDRSRSCAAPAVASGGSVAIALAESGAKVYATGRQIARSDVGRA